MTIINEGKKSERKKMNKRDYKEAEEECCTQSWNCFLNERHNDENFIAKTKTSVTENERKMSLLIIIT